MDHTLELPETVYHALLEAAHASGTTPAEWIAGKLPVRAALAGEAERQAAHARLRQCRVSLGHATGIDNEGIDADLAREYGDNHEPFNRSGESA